jgi:DNA-binding NarL/FixJ family response regulator/class 3 adenylate cyclase
VSVTLLFSDIESSTRLVDRLGDDWLTVLGTQQTLMRHAVVTAGGREIDCRGDEFSIAFERAEDAVGAAVAAQHAFAAHSWPDGADVKVRMGIHTGHPTPAGHSYVGLDVHRTARICAAGHGGQVLLSAEVRQALPAVEAMDLGEFPLRGLPRPERLFQLVAPGLQQEFPPPRVESFTVQAVTSDIAPVKIVIAEDSVLLREGIVRLLEEAGMEVVGQAGTAEELLLRVRSYKPNVAIVDIRMPPTHTDEGVRAAKEIREKHPETAVLVLSQYVEPTYAMELLAESAEGVGYLLKDRVADVPDFVAAVRRVAEGGSALDPAVVSQLVGRRRADDPLSALTPREREVLELMAEGLSNLAIAERLVVTERAVEKHVTSIFSKLRLSPAADAHRRVLAVLAFLRT